MTCLGTWVSRVTKGEGKASIGCKFPIYLGLQVKVLFPPISSEYRFFLNLSINGCVAFKMHPELRLSFVKIYSWDALNKNTVIKF